jgi:hypothetical protein
MTQYWGPGEKAWRGNPNFPRAGAIGTEYFSECGSEREPLFGRRNLLPQQQLPADVSRKGLLLVLLFQRRIFPSGQPRLEVPQGVFLHFPKMIAECALVPVLWIPVIWASEISVTKNFRARALVIFPLRFSARLWPSQ